jgi:mannose-6-phosphate isomerase-like protein (cupin superfamily)
MSFYNFKLNDPSVFSSSNAADSKAGGRFVHKTFQDFQAKPEQPIPPKQGPQPAPQQPVWPQHSPTLNPTHYQVGGTTSLGPPPSEQQAWLPTEIAAVSITSSLQNITHTYSPLHIASLHSSGSPAALRLVKLSGQGVWHSHVGTDEIFILLRGAINMLYRTADGTEKIARVVGGELIVVPMRMEHCVVAEEGTEVLLMEGNEGSVSPV